MAGASFQKLIENDDKNKENDIHEQLERIRRKNQIIALATKKVKAKYKLEKIDKVAKFNNNKLKAFTSLSTFIDTKEYLECASPLQNDKNKSKQYLNSKNMFKLKKLRHESTAFFDGKQQELLERLKELEPVEEKNEETKSKDNISRSSSFTDGESPKKNENSNLPKIMPRNEIKNFKEKEMERTKGILKKKDGQRKVSISSYQKNCTVEEEKEKFVRSPKQRLTADNFLLKSTKEKMATNTTGSMRQRNTTIESDACLNAQHINEKKKKITLIEAEPQIREKKSS